MPRYEEIKTEQAVMDFEDVLGLTAQMLHDNADMAKQVRSQYRHFVVDEFQDVSPIQQRLLDQWLGGRDELCVVGDPSQTIYSFAGATPHFLMNFRQAFPRATLVELVRDYRSSPQIVRVANDLLRSAIASDPAGVKPLELIAQGADGPVVKYTEYGDDDAEAAGVAARVKALIAEGVNAHEIAVLYRTNAQSEAFESALSEAGIGYVVRGGQRFFARKDVRDAMLLLRAAINHAPDRRMPEVVRDVLSDAGWAERAPTAVGAQRERWEAMQALVLLADELDDKRGATMGDFVTELTERADSQHAPTVDGVTLASLHAAKGLEWDAVFLVGVSEGLMPISLAETDRAIAEERRLLYVGITRARTHLELSYARARRAGSRGNRKVSRFLSGIWPAPARPDRMRRSTRGETTIALSGDVDGELFEELRAWRGRVAKEIGKPAYVVFGNISLVAIAEIRPSTLDELSVVRGVGPAKLEAYGEQVLGVVRAHLSAKAGQPAEGKI